MKTKLIYVAACVMIAASASAQKGVDNGTQYGSGEDSINCVTNISLFNPYAKAGNYKDAYPYWKKVYDECPASNKNIYIYGVDIIQWQMSQETDAAKKDALFEDLMKLYDNRVKYFGDDPKYGKDYIVTQKSNMYNNLKGDKTDYSKIYEWTKEVVDEFKEKARPMTISLYMFASFKLMYADLDKFKEQYVNDFLKCSEYFDAQLNAATASNDSKLIEDVTKCKTEIEQNFASSGAADCETLQSIYEKKIEDNKTNLEFLKETMTLLRRVNCKETDAYFAAGTYAYQIEPTAESAMSLGGKAFKNNNLEEVEKYYNEAIGMTEETDVKADLSFALAVLAIQQNQVIKSKGLALKCIAEKAEYGRAYLLIAQAYMTAGKGIFPDDAVLAKTVFYAAADKAEKAKAIDPSIAKDANELINSCQKYYPNKEEIFMHPDLDAGKPFTIGGWVNETVKIR
ncbi:MAG: hypothetical protein LBD53_02110 [Tannerella sp.]|nr:hypothetical protein [Tannerella sp.]